MPTYTLYDKETGELLRQTIICAPEQVAMNVPEGRGVVEGAFDDRCRRVLPDGSIEFFKPPKPPEDELWDYEWEGGRWKRIPSLRMLRNRASSALRFRIAAVEARQPRALREALLGRTEESALRLQQIEDEIAALRTKMAQLEDLDRAELTRLGKKT